jgi:hypothetical protein
MVLNLERLIVIFILKYTIPFSGEMCLLIDHALNAAYRKRRLIWLGSNSSNWQQR